MTKRMMTLLAVLAACVFLSVPAMADTYTFVLNIDGCSGGCGTNPFGTVTVQDTGSGQVSLDINVLPNYLLQTGQPGSTVAFNLQPNVNNLSIVSSTLTGWTLDSASAGTLHASTFGNFEYSLNCCFGQNGGANKQIGHETLTLSGTGLTAASFLQLSTGGSPNVYFAVDIYDNESPNNTGFVGAGNYSVPDGGVTLMLLGGALVGLETLRRKFRV